MKEKQAPEVAAIKMHKSCPKLRPVFSNDSQTFFTSRIDLKFLPHKVDIMRGVYQNFIKFGHYMQKLQLFEGVSTPKNVQNMDVGALRG